ncbi:MAG TPA: SRPBCC family protein [Bacteroidia bacterium]
MKKIKKIFKYILGFISLVVLVFFSFGILTPSIDYDTKIAVSKSAETSFKTFTDVMKLSDWVPGFKGVKLLSGQQLVVGTTIEVTVEQEGKTYVLLQEITGIKENELVEFTLSNNMLSNDCKIRFEKFADHTDIIASDHIQGKNIFWRALFAMDQSRFKKQSAEMYARLKNVIEKSN